MKTEIEIAPHFQYISEFIHSVPLIFLHEGTCIYKARNEIRNFVADGNVCTVKSYKQPHIINQIAYSVFRQSKAKRAFLYAQQLLAVDIPTPDPVAYIEQYKMGLLTHSYFISLFATHKHILRELFDYTIDGNEDLLKALAEFTVLMHEKQVYPIDYSPGNVLFEKVDGCYKFTLLDINRMKFGNVSERMAARCFRRFHMKQEMLEFIVREYAVLRGYEPACFVSEVVKHHRAFWKRH